MSEVTVTMEMLFRGLLLITLCCLWGWFSAVVVLILARGASQVAQEAERKGCSWHLEQPIGESPREDD